MIIYTPLNFKVWSENNSLGINIYKVIDAIRISKFVKNKQVCEMRRAVGLGNSVKHKYTERGKEINMFIKSKSKRKHKWDSISTISNEVIFIRYGN